MHVLHVLLKCFQDRNLNKANTSSSCTGWHCKKRTQNSCKKSHKQVDLCGPVNMVLPLPRTGSLVLWSAVIGPGSAWAALSLSVLNRCPVIAYSVWAPLLWVLLEKGLTDSPCLTDSFWRHEGRGTAFTPSLGAGRRKQLGMGKQALSQKRKGYPLGTLHASSEWLGMLLALCDTAHPKVC